MVIIKNQKLLVKLKVKSSPQEHTDLVCMEDDDATQWDVDHRRRGTTAGPAHALAGGRPHVAVGHGRALATVRQHEEPTVASLAGAAPSAVPLELVEGVNQHPRNLSPSSPPARGWARPRPGTGRCRPRSWAAPPPAAAAGPAAPPWSRPTPSREWW